MATTAVITRPATGVFDFSSVTLCDTVLRSPCDIEKKKSGAELVDEVDETEHGD